MPARNDPSEMSGSFDGFDRRQEPRGLYLTDGMIFVDVGSLGTPAMLVDLSENGLGLQFGIPVPRVQELELKFPVAREQITARCALVWSSRTAWGLKFLDLAEEPKAKIRGWVERSMRQECPITPEGTFASAGSDRSPEGDRANSSDEHEQSEKQSERLADNAPPVLSASAIGPTLPVAEPAAKDEPKIATLSSNEQSVSGDLNNVSPERRVSAISPSGRVGLTVDGGRPTAIASGRHLPTVDVNAAVQTAHLRETPPASSLGDVATSDRRNGGHTSIGAHDWMTRLMARQKQAREELVSAARSQYDQKDVLRLQTPPLHPSQGFHGFSEAKNLPHPELIPIVHSHDDGWDSTRLETASTQPRVPVSHDFDTAIRELRAATGKSANNRSRRPVGFLNGAAGDGGTDLRRATPMILVVTFAVLVLGAFGGFWYGTWVSPPPPVPLPSAVLGFGAVRAAKRFAFPAAAEQPRSSGELLVLGDRCLDGKKSNCGCSTAVESFRAAAILGHPGGLERIATLYSTGECVSANRVEAYRAFLQALASDPNLWVQWNLDAVWERMTAAERTQMSAPRHR